MIYDTKENIELYKSVHPNLYRGLQLMRDTDFSQYELGRYEVDGEDLFFLVQEYNTKAVNNKPEAHILYADIQFVLEGAELMGYAPLDSMVSEQEPRKPGDTRFYDGHIDYLVLKDNRFIVAFPQDVHAPGVSPDGTCAKVRKVVVKVKL